MSHPRVTVLMPVYNGEKFLREAIDSILNQTFKDFELLIINDGSTDKSREIIASYNDPRIHVVLNEKNQGLIAVLNNGINLAKGEFIARMDCDDISLPERLSKEVSFLDNNPEAAMVATHIQLLKSYGPPGVWPEDMTAITNSQIRSCLAKSNCIAHPTVMIRKSVFAKYMYSRRQKGAEDWDLWMRMAADGVRMEKIDEALLQYRIHPESVSQFGKTGAKSQRMVIRIKYNFLLHQKLRLKINGFYFRVFYSLLRSVARYLKVFVIPDALRSVKRILTSNPFMVLANYSRLKKYLSSHNHNLIFFFPYTHIGGAEQVHADVTSCFKDKNPLVFFTGFSKDRKFLPQFERNAKVFNIPYTLNYPIAGKWTQELLADYIAKQTNPLLLGSNSFYYFNLLPKLSSSVFCADIKHTAVEKDDRREAELLPLTMRLTKRIFVSRLALENMKDIYNNNYIPRDKADSFIHVCNSTNVPEKCPPKEMNGPLNVIYVGRTTSEKRVELILQIASKCHEAKLPLRFQLICPAIKSMIDTYPFIDFTGEITDGKKMNSIYDKAHILLLTSKSEGMPLCIIEAMAHGTIPITTNVGDIGLHISNGKNGFIASDIEPEKIVEEMMNFLGTLVKDKELLKTVSLNACQYARDNFSRDQFCSTYKKALLQ